MYLESVYPLAHSWTLLTIISICIFLITGRVVCQPFICLQSVCTRFLPILGRLFFYFKSFFYISWIQDLFIILIALLFHFLMMSFAIQKWSFLLTNILIISLLIDTFCILFKIVFSMPRTLKCVPLLSYTSCTHLCFIHRSTMSLKLIFVYCVREGLTFFFLSICLLVW